MTNEEFLNEKFTQACGPYDDGAKVDYLLKQVNWMDRYLCDTYPTLSNPRKVVVNYIDDYDNELRAEGSCLLEAIENAQKEMIEE